MCSLRNYREISHFVPAFEALERSGRHGWSRCRGAMAPSKAGRLEFLKTSSMARRSLHSQNRESRGGVVELWERLIPRRLLDVTTSCRYAVGPVGYLVFEVFPGTSGNEPPMEVNRAGNCLITFAQVGSERVGVSNYFRLGRPESWAGPAKVSVGGQAGSSLAARFMARKSCCWSKGGGRH